jgi:hypothetical protein
MVRYTLFICPLILNFFAPITFAQEAIFGKYSRDLYPPGSITLQDDFTFKFKFNYDMQWDLACGTFRINRDTIFFYYRSDMFDETCNTEKEGFLNDESRKEELMAAGESIDKRFRPDSILIEGKKLFNIVNGKVYRGRYSVSRKRHRYLRKYFSRKYYLFGPFQLRRKYNYSFKKEEN